MASERIAEGWAVVNDEGICVRTISDTRRAAIINWLVAEANIPVTRWASDKWIETSWNNLKTPETEVIRVMIQPAQRGPR